MTEVETDRTSMTGRRTMKAMVQERYGPASEVLHLRDVPIPEIGADGVLVRVHVGQAWAFGADDVVDYRVKSIIGSGRRFDGIFDIPGNHTLRVCKQLLAEGGTDLMVGGPKGDWTLPDIALALDRQGDFHARGKTLIDVEGAL